MTIAEINYEILQSLNKMNETLKDINETLKSYGGKKVSHEDIAKQVLSGFEIAASAALSDQPQD